jgi:DinB superfamily
MAALIPDTPYTAALEGRDPIDSIRDVLSRVAALTESWTAHDFERSHAPGKWSARKVLLHLAQSELAFGTRVRMALSTPGYTAQPFDQDAWMARESGTSGADALHAFAALGALNLGLYAALSDADRQTQLSHPEYGAMTVDWIIYQQSGHQRHHLRQLEHL